MQNLFRPPSKMLSNDLATVMTAVLAASPLSAAHAKELPFAVRDLSRLLTQDRSQMSSSYWVNKRLLTAYCRYFLPWNLLRLSWLLPGLNLPMPEDGVILDLGSGPLTMPLALWTAKPAWRTMPLTVVCSDVAPAPMTLGREIFRRLDPDSPWKIELARGPVEKVLREFSRSASLITAANVFNEIKPSRETPLQQRFESLMQRSAAKLAQDGRILSIEPGTRLGGKITALIRQAGFSARLVPETPCPHWGACPMLAERATGWCHFSHIADGAPRELADLTRRAGLGKDTLSLSCMLLRKAGEAETERARAHLPNMDDDSLDDDFFDDPEDNLEAECSVWAEAFAASGLHHPENPAQNIVRILSDPIRLPDQEAPARYGCSRQGLVLIRDALRVPSGAAASVTWPARTERDAKSGALIVDLVAPPEKAPFPVSPATPKRQRTSAAPQESHQTKPRKAPSSRRQDARNTFPKDAPSPKGPRNRTPGRRGKPHEQ